jgi:PAS domain S-box-containing protein
MIPYAITPPKAPFLRKRGYLTYAWIASLVVVLTIGWIAWYEKNEIIQNDEGRAELFARLLDDHVLRSLDVAALTITDLAESATLERPIAISRLQAPIEQAVASLTFIRSMALVDQSGRILLSSAPHEQGIDIDMTSLGPLPDNDSVVLTQRIPVRYLGALKVGTHASPTSFLVYSIALVRRIRAQEGHWQYLVTLLNPDFFASFQSVAMGDPDFTAVLMSYAGDVLASNGQPMLEGDQLVNFQVMSAMLKPSGHGTYVGPGAMEGPQIVAVRTSRVWPIVTLVERPLSVATQAWLRSLSWLIVIGVVVIAVIAAISRIAWRSAQLEETAQRKLFEQLAFTDRLLEISPMPVYMLDPQGKVVLVNRALEAFMGMPRDQLLGRSTVEFLSASDELNQTHQNERLFARGGEVSYERRMTKPNGVQRDVLLNKVVVSNDDGSPRGVLAFLMDMTEFRDAERAILQARDAAQAASKTKSEFIANISHELRTPLQSILGFSELAVMQVKDDVKLSRMLRDIHTSGQRMLALVNDLLDIAKIESSVSVAVFQDVDVNRIIQDVVNELNPLLQARNIKVVCKLPDAPLIARLDALRIHQVVRNVVANALKFSGSGQAIQIRAEIHRGDRVHISVRDQGCGIPPQELEAIFEPFIQSSMTKDGSGGTGLGLAICRRILHAHQGNIHAENLPQGGAIFHVDLPRFQADSASVVSNIRS